MSNITTTTTTDPDDAPASQALAWAILGPEMTAFILTIFISGACYQKAATCYHSSSDLSKSMKRILTAVLILNTLVLITTIAELLLWGTTQSRSANALYGFYVPDAYVPILAGLLACIVQAFFANRAWRICNSSPIFLVIVSACIIANLAGAIGLGAVQLLNTSGTTSFTLLLLFTELYTWTSVLTDLLISVVIIVGLVRKKTGYDMPTDSLVSQVINAAMQSASMTTTFALAAAIIYAIQWDMAAASVDLVFLYPLPSIYTYSLLWCLGSTDRVRKEQRSLTQARTATATATMGDDTLLEAAGSSAAMTPLGLNTTTSRGGGGFGNFEFELQEKSGGYGSQEITSPVKWGSTVAGLDFSDVVKSGSGDAHTKTAVRVREMEREGSDSSGATRRGMSFGEMLRAENESGRM